LLINNNTILKGLIRKLKETLSFIREDAVEKARKDYRNYFTNAGKAQNPRDWVLQWKTLYFTAKSYQVEEVEGFLAVTDFLVAVRKKMAPNWAHNFILSQNNKIVWGEKRKTLFEYRKAFQRVVYL
jgi:CRISPR/Cas system Type II protein with McrA/HNH and RuvC-like nuclease domain